MHLESTPLSQFERLILSLGEPCFEHELIRSMRHFAAVDHCSLLRFQPGEKVHLVGSASCPGGRVSPELQAAYVSHFHRHDPNFRIVDRAPRAGLHRLNRLRASDISSSDYRRCCFDPAQLVDRVSIITADGNAWYSLNLYRKGRRGGFSNTELHRLSELEGSLTALTLKHNQLINQTTNLDFMARGVADFEQRLATLGYGLTNREFPSTVC